LSLLVLGSPLARPQDDALSKSFTSRLLGPHFYVSSHNSTS